MLREAMLVAATVGNVGARGAFGHAPSVTTPIRHLLDSARRHP